MEGKTVRDDKHLPPSHLFDKDNSFTHWYSTHDNSILSVYHHWDGYPQWLGRILKTHYNTKEKVADLIDGGDMSCAWTKDRWTGKKVAEYVTENVEVEEYGPQYYSQRGEESPPRLDDSIFKYLDKDNNEEYAYIWSVNNEWKCVDMTRSMIPYTPEFVECHQTTGGTAK